MKTKYKYPITYLEYDKDFFEEDGFELTDLEVNDKLIEDKNKIQYNEKSKFKSNLKKIR